MSESNWELQKSKSSYHFDTSIVDPRYDNVQGLGKFTGDWSQELEQVIESARPVSWRTRSKTGEAGKWIDQEEYDLKEANADPNMIITNMEYNLSPVFREMCDKIGLANREDRIHVQWPGQVFTIHIDKLEKIYPEDPTKVMRIMIQLTDWEQGQFAQYGNYTHQGWKAGDIYTFAWKHTPHSSANASLKPRVSLLTTGIKTKTTRDFLKEAFDKKEIQIAEYQAWMEYGVLDK